MTSRPSPTLSPPSLPSSKSYGEELESFSVFTQEDQDLFAELHKSHLRAWEKIDASIAKYEELMKENDPDSKLPVFTDAPVVSDESLKRRESELFENEVERLEIPPFSDSSRASSSVSLIPISWFPLAQRQKKVFDRAAAAYEQHLQQHAQQLQLRLWAGSNPCGILPSEIKRPSESQAWELKDKLDLLCGEAARAISEADVFLLCTGAGFSADSGLATYADVAKVHAYSARDLEYHDVCKPQWLQRDPDLFWGFWGQCYNDYRDTPPHEGYEIINSWVDRWFRGSSTASTIRAQLADAAMADADAAGCEDSTAMGSMEPYRVTDHAGAFFVFTSNVDAHHFDWFRACEIRECHGNTEIYQCGRDSACYGIWRAPLDFNFVVDKTTMLAPAKPTEESKTSKLMLTYHRAKVGLGYCNKAPAAQAAFQNVAAPRIGCVRGGGRKTLLRHMPGSPLPAAEVGFAHNHPVCPKCGGPARPAILMFADGNWQDLDSQKNRWNSWSRAVCSLAIHRPSAEQKLRVVILEIGAGNNVPTVRSTSENTLTQFLYHGADARLVRVNPDFPLGDDKDKGPDGMNSHRVISLMGRGLDCIKRMSAALEVAKDQTP